MLFFYDIETEHTMRFQAEISMTQSHRFWKSKGGRFFVLFFGKGYQVRNIEMQIFFLYIKRSIILFSKLVAYNPFSAVKKDFFPFSRKQFFRKSFINATSLVPCVVC